MTNVCNICLIMQMFYSKFVHYIFKKCINLCRALNKGGYMQHRGEIVEKAVRNSGISIKRLHDTLGLSRGTIYNKFDDAYLDFDFIVKVGEVIKHDFSVDFPELALFPEEVADTSEVPGVLIDCQRELMELQRKYIDLMESHLKLMKLYQEKE